jgi:hypothetical protein
MLLEQLSQIEDARHGTGIAITITITEHEMLSA